MKHQHLISISIQKLYEYEIVYKMINVKAVDASTCVYLADALG